MNAHAQLVIETKPSEPIQALTPQQQEKKAVAKKMLHLIKDYFLNSNEKLTAWLLLISSLLCVITLVGLMTTLTWWSTGFWSLLLAKAALTPFLISLGQFALLTGSYMGFYVLQTFLIGKLAIRWRNWLTKKFINELFDSKNNYLDLKRITSSIDNVAQRIQEDIKNFVELTLNLGINFLNSALNLCAYTVSLWIVGGPLSFALLGLNIVIPGYLVWVALIVSVTATAITHAIGKTLPQKTKKNECAEADLRQDLAQLNQEAENIAEEHAEDYYKTLLAKKIEDVKNTANQRLSTQTKLSAFQSFYSQLSSILPTIFAAPLYFSGAIQIEQLTQIGICFSQVNQALNVFINSYESITSCRASIERIVDLQNGFEKDGLPVANAKAICRRTKEEDSISINNLNIMRPQAQPSGTNYIMRGLELKLQPGEHVLIQGPSGIGKSTVFKAISGTWKYGDGKICVPTGDDKKFYFLPQTPVLPCDTLEAVLAYPQPANTYTTIQYHAALQAVGGMEDFIPILNQTRNWTALSSGQQQRISFARALLKKPTWLFLDEATSALDEESEDHVYRMVQDRLKDTTIVSIGHRNTIKKYHSKIVFFQVDEKKEVTLKTEPVMSLSA